MTRFSPLLTLILVSAFFLLTAFQCGSPEFTGGKVYLQQQKFDQALEQFEKEVKKNPTNAEAWRFIGLIKAEKNDYKGMNEAFDQVKKLTPKHNDEIYKLRFNKWAQHINAGLNYFQKGSPDSTIYYEKAINEYNQAIVARPDTGVTYKYLAIVQALLEREDDALESYGKSWEMDKDTDSQKQRAFIYYNRGDKLRAKFEEVNAEELDNLKKLADVRKGMSREEVVRKFGMPEPANIIREKPRARPAQRGRVTRTAPTEPVKETWVYPKFNLRMNMEDQSVASFEFGKKYEPKIDSTYHRQALVEFSKAVDVLEIAKRAKPGDNTILDLLMRSYVQADRLKEATSTFELAVQNDPNNKNNRFLLGVLFRSGGRNDEAIVQFQKAIEIDPLYGDVYYDLAVTYYNWGVEYIRQSEAAMDRKDEKKTEELREIARTKFASALPYLEKVAAEFRKDDPAVYETLGRIYVQVGEQEKALKSFETADQLRNGPAKQ